MSDEEYYCLCAISSTPHAQYLANNAKLALDIVTGNNKEYITNTKTEETEVVLKGSDIYRYAIGKSITKRYLSALNAASAAGAKKQLNSSYQSLLHSFVSPFMQILSAISSAVLQQYLYFLDFLS